MGKLLLLFICLPAAELALLIEIGQRIGTSATLGLILLTGVIGASLARQQGLRVIGRVQQELGSGRLPASSLVDGLIIVVASALLITPGVLTDVFGFLCLMPAFRTLIKRQLLVRFERAVAEQRIHVQTVGGREFGDQGFDFQNLDVRPPGPEPIIDVNQPPRRGRTRDPRNNEDER
jgi:UPF0716 protein FxsA